MEKIDVRGVRFMNAAKDEVIAFLWDRYENGEQSAVFTPNPEIVQRAIDNPEYMETLNSAEAVIPDGIGIIKAAKILKTPLKEKIPGIEVGERIIAGSAEHGAKVFFLGSKPGVAEAARKVMEERYPGTVFVGTNDGYFEKEGAESDAVCEKIAASGATVLFVCLGAPAQENWISQNRVKLPGVLIFLALGGSLDAYSGTVNRAPEFFLKHNLEWFYRLIKQPTRIGRMMSLPKFYFGTLRYRRKLKKEKRSRE